MSFGVDSGCESDGTRHSLDDSVDESEDYLKRFEDDAFGEGPEEELAQPMLPFRLQPLLPS